MIMKKMPCFLDYEVDECRLDDSFIGAVHSEQDSSLLMSINSDIDREYCEIMLQ